MRPGILLGTLGIGTLVLLALVSFSPKVRMTSVAEPVATVSGDPNLTQAHTETGGARPAEMPQKRLTRSASPKQNRVPTAENTQAAAEQHEAQVAARIGELRDLARKTDAASWETLLSELQNPDEEIREAALDIISQSGNRAAIPRLTSVAAQTEDAREKKAIIDAIEFLKLPTLTEVLSQAGQGGNNKEAAEEGKSRLPRGPGTRNP